MNTSKKIYFLSAFVLIIGCLALNLSYSLFVQTEEKEIVDATIPSLAYSLETSTFTIPANSDDIITLKINNTGTAKINYCIFAEERTTLNQKIQVVEGIDNDILGQVEGNSTKVIELYVMNSEETDMVVNFGVIANYSTLNFKFVDDPYIIRDPKYKRIFLNELIVDNAIVAGNENLAGFSHYRTTPLTKVAEETSSYEKDGVFIQEQSLSVTSDDFTQNGKEVYYYRGNVQDNYVNFAGMCWRIVRTDGNGNIKLILEDQYATCNDKETVETNEVYTGNWNVKSGYFGFDASQINNVNTTVYRLNYLNPIPILELDNDLFMANVLYNFQGTLNNKISSLYNKLISDYLLHGNWCLDNKAYDREKVDFEKNIYLSDSDKDTKYRGGTDFYYDSYIRLYGNRNSYGYSPTLKCNGYVIDDFGGNKYDALMYVGALTADEVAYAGGIYVGSDVNNYHYLINEEFKKGFAGAINDDKFFTFTPATFVYYSDTVAILNNSGEMNNNPVGLITAAIRPVITLKSDVQVKTQSLGTIDDPHVIK